MRRNQGYNYKWQVLAEYNGSDEFQQWFAYGNYIDEVLMMGTTASPTSARFYIHDHLYSPAALTDYSGSVLERYEYDAYGKCYIMDASYNQRTESSYGNPYYFTGRRLDELDNGSLKVYNYRHRYYDMYMGRFITHDPLGINPAGGTLNPFSLDLQYIKGLNLYEYTMSNPIVSLDYYGLISVPGWPTVTLNWRLSGTDTCYPTGSAGISLSVRSLRIIRFFRDAQATLDISGRFGWTDDTYSECKSKFQPWIWNITRDIRFRPISHARSSYRAGGSSPNASATVGIFAQVYIDAVYDFGVHVGTHVVITMDQKNWFGDRCKCMKTTIIGDLHATQRENLAPATAVASLVAVYYATPIVIPIVEGMVAWLEQLGRVPVIE
ncbi:MAG: hypothetical protein OEW48_18080 [Phycisphaerae bacterium]|nr:hypothetical protein [Phycisphaerae bacterium]